MSKGFHGDQAIPPEDRRPVSKFGWFVVTLDGERIEHIFEEPMDDLAEARLAIIEHLM
jgi:hypothetical protein